MHVEVNGTTLRLVQGDITNQRVDAVVNAANSSLMGGGGVDGAIHRKGGPEILEACKKVREEMGGAKLPTGEAVTTTAGNMPVEKVIHTVGPVWKGGDAGEYELLANAYRHSLEQAAEHGLKTVAFPSISTGAYGFPIEEAAEVAIETIREFLENHPDTFDEVRMVLFSVDDLQEYERALM
ncbi:O-acetyl-ADP-ribose deacetylase [Persicimonas caeni]|uniref:O-acetyl-ADP-ribose deacetylase n=1 Tax=Persicimonas caeni TaxID=2292766 RepID=A0A4Y6PNJ4_PERCE|nr:O-acetyl-ADP-ribose deacetylase [Persicimonas caeni]QDG49881.1 O-acetyl-ADP-ribose deacetylase [Persicimonas caeni]QED31102.1 O-acetyl-ADP-ribose deacetylase [Persicimonas caeni]